MVLPAPSAAITVPPIAIPVIRDVDAADILAAEKEKKVYSTPRPCGGPRALFEYFEILHS
jgi:hypothetical protein